MCDIDGRDLTRDAPGGMNPYKARFAQDTMPAPWPRRWQAPTFSSASRSANVVTPDMVRSMAARPIIFAMANPDPEIPYEVAKAARPDAIVATGRSDYPNQVNNVLGFPFIFRGALDVHARQINDEMKVAAAHALAAAGPRRRARFGAQSLQTGSAQIWARLHHSQAV